jgi:hypothetical protein
MGEIIDQAIEDTKSTVDKASTVEPATLKPNTDKDLQKKTPSEPAPPETVYERVPVDD